ncbi:MAG: hypothetical protein DI585_04435 [Pseudomonas fluorescens]|nr:MAG: hypothetical protein DI585_04435 [Pseudomonas fluorescens]
MLTVVVALLGFFATDTHAQERSASGNGMEAKMSWKALSDMASATNGRVDDVERKLNDAVTCGKQGMLYAPGSAGANASGCRIATVDNTIINKFINCGNNNQVYSQASDSCKTTATAGSSANCSLQTVTTNNGSCPAGYSNFGTVFAGYQRPTYHDGCETCNPIYTTTCGRSVCQ